MKQIIERGLTFLWILVGTIEIIASFINRNDNMFLTGNLYFIGGFLGMLILDINEEIRNQTKSKSITSEKEKILKEINT